MSVTSHRISPAGGSNIPRDETREKSARSLRRDSAPRVLMSPGVLSRGHKTVNAAFPGRKSTPGFVMPDRGTVADEDVDIENLPDLLAFMQRTDPAEMRDLAQARVAGIDLGARFGLTGQSAWRETLAKAEEAIEILAQWRALSDATQAEISQALKDNLPAAQIDAMRIQLRHMADAAWPAFKCMIRLREMAKRMEKAGAAAPAIALPPAAVAASAINRHLKAAGNRDVASIGSLLILLGKAAQLMLAAGEQKVGLDYAFLQEQQKARGKMLEKMVSEARTQREKAAKANSVLDWVTKGLGIGLIALGLAGAILSGGLSLVLAGIGVGIMVADEVYKALSGESFIEKITEPLMEAIQPVFGEIIHAMSGMLEWLGVDSLEATIAASVVVALIFGAAILVLTLTGAGGAVAQAMATLLRTAGRTLIQPIEVMLSRLLPQLARDGARRVARLTSERLAQSMQAMARRLRLSEDPLVRQIQGQRLTLAAGVVGGMQATSSAAMSVNEGAYQVFLAQTMAGLKRNESESNVMTEMQGRVLEQYQARFDAAQGFFEQLASLIQQRAQTGMALAQGIRNAHAI